MHVYLSGIGGIGMSAYAAHMRSRGHTVSGSDIVRTPLTVSLEKSGIRIAYAQDGTAIPDDIDVFVYSEAIPEDAPERMEARKRDIPQQSYFQALGELTRGTQLIAVAGTHGKTSTTAMIARLLIKAGYDPSVVVGACTPELDNKNWRKGAGDLWLVEACEYRQSFRHLRPKIIVLTNVDYDHPDAFPTREEYEQAYVSFLDALPPSGAIIHHGSDEGSVRVTRFQKSALIDADAQESVELAVPGEHMRQNARLALALAELLGIDTAVAREALSGYRGSGRRMEVRGETPHGMTVIDDYAHHPKEIRATLAALKERYVERKILCVFQPHTHDRTKALWDDFASAFSDADRVIVTDVYDARPDRERTKADPAALADTIREKSGTDAIHGGSHENVVREIRDHAEGKEVLVVMGAGDSTRISDALLAR